jgi:uncharacterized protein (TIGR02996 family)
VTDGDALYRAILAAPADDTPRLVYADWLDEHGRAAEAEFVRLGCGLDADAPDHPEYADRVARQEELELWLKAHAPQPRPEFGAGLDMAWESGWWYHTGRGFHPTLGFSGDGRAGLGPMRELAAALEKAFAAVPTRLLYLSSVTPEQLAEFLRHPVVGQLDGLILSLWSLDLPGPEFARLVAGCPRLANLRRLGLGFHPWADGLAALAGSPHLGRLDDLFLELESVSAAEARGLAAADWFRNLRTLNVRPPIDPGAFEELCRAGPFPRLHTLDISGGGNTFPAPAWEEFARSAAFPALARLNLAHSDLGYGRAAILAGARWLRPAHLDLSECGLGNDGAAALAAAPWLGAVRWLGLGGNRLTPAGVKAIAGSPAVSGLRYLDLSGNAVGPTGLRVVSRNPALRGLRTLRLRGGLVDPPAASPAHFHRFLAELDLPALRHLDLSNQRVGARAARLLTADRFRPLARLGLERCGLTDTTAAALRAALPDLVELKL